MKGSPGMSVRLVIIAVVPVVLVLGFQLVLLSGANNSPVTTALNFMQQLPVNPWLYLYIALLVGLYLSWRWWMFDSLDKEFQTKEEADKRDNLTHRDWRIVQGLRKRAFALRTRADLILGGTFALLFVGIYLTLFVLREIRIEDVFQVELAREELFKNQVGNTLQFIAEGRYWFKIPENYSEDKLREINNELNVDVNGNTSIFQEFSVLKTTDGGKNWSISAHGGEDRETPNLMFNSREWVIMAAFGADGKTGMVAGDEGSVFMTTDGGKNWNKSNLALERGEWIISAAFSADGKTGMVAGDEGSVFMTTDGGKNWILPNLALKSEERVIAAAFSVDGENGVVAGDGGSVFMTTNGGKNWNKSNLELENEELIITAAFSVDGENGVVAGDGGSVFMTTNGGKNWNKSNLELENEELIITAAFGADGRTGMAAGGEGSVFMTTDGGKNWNKSNLELENEELIITAAFGADGRTGMAAGDEGSVFMTTDGGKNWDKSNLELENEELIITAAFGADGRTGMAAGDEGSVFMTTDGGKNWSKSNLALERGELVIAVVVSADGEAGVVYRLTNLVFVKKSDRGDWSKSNLALERGEWIISAAFSADSKTGMVAGDEGSVFMTTDGGKNWILPNLALKSEERVIAAAFSVDGENGVVAGDGGSVFKTTDGGEIWSSTKGEDLDQNHFSAVGLWNPHKGKELGQNLRYSQVEVSSHNDIYVAKTGDEVLYHLPGAYSKLDEWDSLSLEDIRNKMNKDEILRNSKIFSDITEFMYGAVRPSGDRTDDGIDKTDNGTDNTNGDGEGYSDEILSDLTVMRTVTLAVLFFLVQILVRLHQYSLRLSAFLESRADAVLLSGSFAGNKAKRFDDLVGALAPDAYDFKSPPRSPLDWFRPQKP